MPDRAVIFVDGNNWYHSLKASGLPDLSLLDDSIISKKLLGAREWVGTRYYIGRVSQAGNPKLYADQRRFLASLRTTDSRISTHLGRLEPRPFENPAAQEPHAYLASLTVRIDRGVYHELLGLARRHNKDTVLVEKAVDVKIAVDMVAMAQRDEFDAAYLLSADGDFTPAVEEVKACSKKVYAASPGRGAQLAAVGDAFIRLDRLWFADCYRSEDDT